MCLCQRSSLFSAAGYLKRADPGWPKLEPLRQAAGDHEKSGTRVDEELAVLAPPGRPGQSGGDVEKTHASEILYASVTLRRREITRAIPVLLVAHSTSRYCNASAR